MKNYRVILILQVVALMSCQGVREEGVAFGRNRSIAMAIIVNFSLFYERLNGGLSLLEAKLLRDVL